MIILHLSPNPVNDEEYHAYQIADQVVLVDQYLKSLAAFKTAKLGDTPPSRKKHHQDAEAALIYQGAGWIAGENRQFTSRVDSHAYYLKISDICTFIIDATGSEIWVSESSLSANPGQIIEAAVGPALILALAIKGIWCLHASAVLVDDRLVGLMGESGKGKSTLAWYIGSQTSKLQTRVGDDVLPLTQENDIIQALPHYPQLKLSDEEQPVNFIPGRIKIDAIYSLEVDSQRSMVEIYNLTASQAALALVRHTIASRLFDQKLLGQNLEFCSQAAQVIPIKRLVYPHDHDLLPALENAIRLDRHPS